MKTLQNLTLVLFLLLMLPSCGEEVLLVIHNRSGQDVVLHRKGWIDYPIPSGGERTIPLVHFILSTTYIEADGERWTYPDAPEALNAASSGAARSYIFRNIDDEPQLIVRLGSGGRLDLLRVHETGKIVRPREQPPGFPLWPYALAQ